MRLTLLCRRFADDQHALSTVMRLAMVAEGSPSVRVREMPYDGCGGAVRQLGVR